MMSDARYETLYRLFYETFALAIRTRSVFPVRRSRDRRLAWVHRRAVDCGRGSPRRGARIRNDDPRRLPRISHGPRCDPRSRAVNRGVELWLDAIDSASLAASNKESMQRPDATPRRGATIFIFVLVTIDMISIGIIAPVLPKLITSFLGGNVANAAVYQGAFTTVWALGQFICSPLLGMLSDKVGRRPVILISCLVTAIDFAIMALAPNLWWLFAGRMLSGVATANLSTATRTSPTSTPPENRAKAYGLLSSAFGIGFVLGPAIGGLAGNVDARLPFWIAAGFSLSTGCTGSSFCRNRFKPEHRTAKVDWKRANPVGSLRMLASHHETLGPELGEPRNLCRA